MVGKSKAPTADERRRMKTIKEHTPCIPCMLISRRMIRYPEVRHVVEGMKRLGHRYTYGLCPWHHRGVIDNNRTTQSMIGQFGPSLSGGKKPFQQRFGPERLLVKVQDYLLEEYDRSPWDYYSVPHEVRRDMLLRWTDATQ